MGHTHAMTPEGRTQITLELESGADPIAGRIVRGGSDPGRRFVGWLGLAEALQLALAGTPRRELGDPRPSGATGSHPTAGRART
jgi:hypothetical protein